MGGRSLASARTAVDFAVPFSPRTSTPPTSGETALRSKASLRSSCPTMAEKGYGTIVMKHRLRGLREEGVGFFPSPDSRLPIPDLLTLAPPASPRSPDRRLSGLRDPPGRARTRD